MNLSVIVPLYNEHINIRVLRERLTASLQQVENCSWSVLFVDDGSVDGSAEELAQICREDARFQLLVLSRNFGQMAALLAGLDHVDSEMVVLMDGDLQDPPELIPEMVKLWRGGAEVVVGERKSREADDWRNWSSQIFHWIFDGWSGRHVDQGTFSLLDRRAVEAIRHLRESSSFFPGLRRWVGFRQQNLPYHRNHRLQGNPKQTPRRLFRYALDALFGFTRAPIYLVSAVSLLTGLAGLVCLAFQQFLYAAIAISVSLNTFCLVIIGGYVTRTLEQVRERPKYIVKASVPALKRFGD